MKPLLLHWPVPWSAPAGLVPTVDPERIRMWKDIGIGLMTDAVPRCEIPLVSASEHAGLGCIVTKALQLGSLQPYITAQTPLQGIIAGWADVDKGWRQTPAMVGYRLFHEAHRQKPDPVALQQVIRIIRRHDRERYLFGVGNLAVQVTDTPEFSKSFFQDEKCVYLHEFYPNRVARPWNEAMALWVAEVKKFWRKIGSGRWWAILYMGDETVGGTPYYSAPTPEQFKEWWITAFLCGASGISLFCGSSGEADGRVYTALDKQPELHAEVKRLGMFVDANKHLLNTWQLKNSSLLNNGYEGSFNGTARAGFYVPGFGLNYEMDGEGVITRR